MKNFLISSAKSVFYGLTEPIKLRLLRDDYPKPLPLVSVYIPTHNRRDLLINRSLKSVLRQTYKNLEIIVVAHGCTDGTNIEVAKAWLYDKRIRFVSIPRQQTYPATLENHWFAGRVIPSNVGLDNCNGDWIATNDDDDVWTEDHVQSLLSFAVKNDYEFVSAGSVNQDGWVKPYELDGVRVGGIGTWLYRAYLGKFKFNPDCWRKSWNKVCDTDLQDRFRRAGVRMGYLDKVVTRILPRPGDNAVGLAAAKANSAAYMNHLAFK